MSRTEQKTIENIIKINPMLFGLQNELEKEQNKVIADLALPAIKAVSALMEIDNKRIDLCNLNVLYGFIERGLGENFGLLCACANAGIKCNLYKAAVEQLTLAGYTVERVNAEFEYLFKLLKNDKKRKKRLAFNAQTATDGQRAAD